MTNCGDGGESCCTSLEVPAGTYDRTYSNMGAGPTGETDPASVSCFRLDKYEVTVGRFRQFRSAWAAGYLPPPGAGKHVHVNGGLGLADGDAPGSYETGWVASDDDLVAPTDANLDCGIEFPSSPFLSMNYATWTPPRGARRAFRSTA